MSSYDKPKQGEWVQAARKGHLIGCCGCGLVHTFDFRVVGRQIQFRAWLDRRATAAVRREREKKKCR